MKFSQLAAITLLAPLLLTGCSSSDSSGEQRKPTDIQAKLIEYESCLAYHSEVTISGFRESVTRGNVEGAKNLLENVSFAKMLEVCSDYRP